MALRSARMLLRLARRSPLAGASPRPWDPNVGEYILGAGRAGDRRGFYASRIANFAEKSPAPENPEGGKTKAAPGKAIPANDVVKLGFRTWVSLGMQKLRHDLNEVPPLARTLGLAGAIPFVALSPPFVYVLPLPELLSHGYADAQAAYGAVILSFLGGPHWGIAMVDYGRSELTIRGLTATSTRYLWSVTPSLLGWFALLLPTVPRLEVLFVSFGSALVVDFFMTKAKLLPTWYLPLRVLLTMIAMAAMGSSIVVEVTKETLEAATAASPR